jgi:3-hydroxybutyryl-CoA dehydrogenase
MLKESKLVIECTLEDLDIKKDVYAKIEKHVADDTIITSNTSAIPISILQKNTKIPSRLLGLHWAEPSHTTRFLEIICGDESDAKYAEWLYELSSFWGKEPTLVRKDIRGFITNRLMYAMYREAFNLVENGYASVEDVDRACRNNAGYWMTLVGLFRWMDLTGVAAYHHVMKDLFPTLSNQTEVPKLIDDIVKAGGKGISNAHGFYDYTPEEARLWKETFEEFSYEIRRLALKYPADVVKKKLARQKVKE